MSRLSSGKSRAFDPDSRKGMIGVAQDGNLEPSAQSKVAAKAGVEAGKVALKASGVGTMPMLAAEAIGLDKVIENQLAGRLDQIQQGGISEVLKGGNPLASWQAGRMPTAGMGGLTKTAGMSGPSFSPIGR
ncbi:MAG: hypothetical protein AAF213_10065 [Pseudomonadota bacterium]